MADLMDIGNDIQESISRSYDIPEGLFPSLLHTSGKNMFAHFSMENDRQTQRDLFFAPSRPLLHSQRILN